MGVGCCVSARAVLLHVALVQWGHWYPDRFSTLFTMPGTRAPTIALFGVRLYLWYYAFVVIAH